MQQPSAHKAAAADDDRNRKPSRKKLRTRFNDARLLELTGSLFFFLFFFFNGPNSHSMAVTFFKVSKNSLCFLTPKNSSLFQFLMEEGSFRAGLGKSLRFRAEPPGTGAATPGNAEKRLSTLNKVKSLG